MALSEYIKILDQTKEWQTDEEIQTYANTLKAIEFKKDSIILSDLISVFTDTGMHHNATQALESLIGTFPISDIIRALVSISIILEKQAKEWVTHYYSRVLSSEHSAEQLKEHYNSADSITKHTIKTILERILHHDIADDILFEDEREQLEKQHKDKIERINNIIE